VRGLSLLPPLALSGEFLIEGAATLEKLAKLLLALQPLCTLFRRSLPRFRTVVLWRSQRR
jgi:hypothetical protein